jgi:hypothetical protein
MMGFMASASAVSTYLIPARGLKQKIINGMGSDVKEVSTYLIPARGLKHSTTID